MSRELLFDTLKYSYPKLEILASFVTHVIAHMI